MVFETAVTPRHGQATGNLFDCSHAVSDSMQPYFVRWLCPLAEQLAAVSLSSLPTSPLWQDLQRSFGGEQLAYIATLAVHARLLFGDRPKRDTYHQLLTQPSIADLDAAFATQAALNTLELLDGVPAVHPEPASDPVASIMLTERDTVLSQSCCTALAESPPRSCVIAVVGEAHLPGMQLQLRQAEATASSKVSAPTCRSDDISSGSSRGVQQALVESVLRLQCGSGVLQDFQEHAPQLYTHDLIDYETVLELYGSARMLLAVLPPELLQRVCIGWRVDMWQVLQPLRQARPINGGNPVNEDLVLQLRLLDLQA